MKKVDKGFTLMEMLIVVAIIAILIAIAIPVLANQLEKSKEATDLANLRSAYTEIMAASLYDDASSTKIEKTSKGYKTYVRCKSQKKYWQTKGVPKNESGLVKIGESYCTYPDKEKPYIRVQYSFQSGTISFDRMGENDMGSNPRFFN